MSENSNSVIQAICLKIFPPQLCQVNSVAKPGFQLSILSAAKRNIFALKSRNRMNHISFQFSVLGCKYDLNLNLTSTQQKVIK